MVKVGCSGVTGPYQSKEYSFDINREKINRITCFDKGSPMENEDCRVDPSEFLECGEGQAYVIEMFDLASLSG